MYINNVSIKSNEVRKNTVVFAIKGKVNDGNKYYPYNPEKARQLISEAGADGAELTFFVTEGGSGELPSSARRRSKSSRRRAASSSRWPT